MFERFAKVTSTTLSLIIYDLILSLCYHIDIFLCDINYNLHRHCTQYLKVFLWLPAHYDLDQEKIILGF